MRARFEPDGRGLGASEREGGEGEERLTGGARLSFLTLRQRAGELTDDVAGHGEARGGQGLTQRRVAVPVEVVVVSGVSWFAGDEVRGGGASGVDGSGRFRLQNERERGGNGQ